MGGCAWVANILWPLQMNSFLLYLWFGAMVVAQVIHFSSDGRAWLQLSACIHRSLTLMDRSLSSALCHPWGWNGLWGSWVSLAQWLYSHHLRCMSWFCFTFPRAVFFKTTAPPDFPLPAPQISPSWPYPRATPFASSTWWTVSCPASCSRGQETWAWVCPSTSPATPCSPTWSHTSRAWRWAPLGEERLLPA